MDAKVELDTVVNFFRRGLPALPKRMDKKLDSGIINGLMVNKERFQLIDQKRSGTYSWGSADHMHVLEKNVDFTKVNFVRRKLITFGKNYKNETFRKSINQELAGGGESNPILTTLLGLAMGVVGVGVAGLVYTGFSTALSFAPNYSQPARVRDGDEIHHIEIIGMYKGKLYHVELIVLIDPFRVKAERDIKQWIIHDSRRKVTIK